VRHAVAALTVALDVYRTYLDDTAISASDRARLERAAAAAGARLQGEARRALELVTTGLLQSRAGDDPWLTAARRWQQLSGAVMAKGVEDTATYRYPGLLAQAEVGADPDRSAGGVDEFHRFARRRGRGLNTTSTHDSKRNEDARARLFVLSEEAALWERLVRRWHRRLTEGRARAPHPAEEWAAYQSLLALWPMGRDRMDRETLGRVEAYAEKAAREAKRRTSWDDPDLGYERALRAHVRRAAGDPVVRADMGRVLRRIAPAAVTNSLSMLVLKCCVPGTPDLYQGTELVAPALTDPDNRRPVDFDLRRRLLEELPPPEARAVSDLLRRRQEGALKLLVVRSLLHLRRDRGALFDAGEYRSLRSSSEHVVAFARHHQRDALLCVVPRLVRTLAGPGRFPLGPVWADETVSIPRDAAGSYSDVLSGRSLDMEAGPVDLRRLLGVLPVAVLRRTGPTRRAR
jgi:(1->4)-alpha-D-glucan 1-alpha-D-glucosylmutase